MIWKTGKCKVVLNKVTDHVFRAPAPRDSVFQSAEDVGISPYIPCFAVQVDVIPASRRPELTCHFPERARVGFPLASLLREFCRLRLCVNTILLRRARQQVNALIQCLTNRFQILYSTKKKITWAPREKRSVVRRLLAFFSGKRCKRWNVTTNWPISKDAGLRWWIRGFYI